MDKTRTGKKPLSKGIALVVIGATMLGGSSVWVASQGQPSLAPLYTENVPTEGAETVYGLPLAWENAHLFAAWYDAIQLEGQEVRVFEEALAPLAAPCCDDNPLARCCCERGGLICNVVRTTRGLGAYLVQAGYEPEAVTAAMEQWLRFIHGDYYVARALADQGEDPRAYGLFQPANGACYRGLCNAPLQEGGCGGMGHEVVVDESRL
ncbi:hypothetical protein H5T55_00420 [Candidatus Bipolaricaulota bacterium]|nr:hypothetical protein [Candidatus Bipolaricaulota bacterium]